VFAYVGELERWLHAAEPADEAKAAIAPKPAVALTPEPRSTADDQPVSAFQSLNSLAAAVALESAVSVPAPGDGRAGSIQPSTDSRPPVESLLRIGSLQAASLLACLTLAIGIAAGVVRYQESRAQHPGIHIPTPAARELYLRGRYFWNLRTEAGLNRAVDLFTQSIVTDPQYAAAYAGLADSYILLRQYGSMPDSEAFPRALAAAKQAIALDDKSPDAHRSLAFILRFWSWDMAAAEVEYRRAIALNPGDSQSHHWYATALLSSGRTREALEQIDTARALEPQSVSVLADRGLILAAIDPHTGVAALEQAVQAEPNFRSTHRYLAGAYLRLGDYRGFLAESRAAASLGSDPALLPTLDRAQRTLASRGPGPMLRELADGYAKLVGGSTVSDYETAQIFSLAGEPEKALHYLQLACDRHEASFVGVEGDFAFAPLHTMPEYTTIALLRDVSFGNARRPVAQLDTQKPF